MSSSYKGVITFGELKEEGGELMDVIQKLINQGWNVVNIKTEDKYLENVVLNDISFGKFDFGNIGIASDCLKIIDDTDENSIVLEGSYIIIADFIPSYKKTPSIERESYLAKITITKVN